MFFGSFWELIRVVVVGTLAYAALIVMLRISGKRTLSKMNAFDMIVTIALGSTLASSLLSSDVSLTEALAAFTVLVGLQFIVTWLSVRYPKVQGLVKSEPRLLMLRGEFLDASMRAERFTKEEVDAAVRAAGAGSLTEVEAVVLETDGSVSVIRRGSAEPPDAIRPVSGFPVH